jgi:cell division protein ZapA (FtsZ GTPase activity inhibitor)
VSGEVLAYDSPEDATEKIFWAFQNPELAKTIALEGQKRTLECHTYEKIINDLAIQLNQKV